jgi:alpha-glucosidase
MLADNLGALIESHLIGNLNPDPTFDTAWIRPGKTAWDWWSGPYLPPPDKGGTDMPTIQKYIDFAGRSGFEYMMIDEGWCLNSGVGGSAPADADVTKTKPGIDMPALVAHGAKRNVGLWLWVQWSLLDRQMDEALAQYAKWGIKGIKVDFMDRNDQQMVAFYHRLLSQAAQHHLMVDLHGAYPPDGLARTWPNFVTQEGVLGAEYNKFGSRITATHNVTLPFTRMLLGPMDYTPGGFHALPPAEFAKQRRMIRPFVQTTRGQALAMYVVYDSPLVMLADSPDSYVASDGTLSPGADFLKEVPTTWDETRFIAGDVGQYVVLARRKGETWYVGAMTNESSRKIRVPLNFLDDGDWQARMWQDGADMNSVITSTAKVGPRTSLSLSLAGSGGAVAILTRTIGEKKL